MFVDISTYLNLFNEKKSNRFTFSMISTHDRILAFDCDKNLILGKKPNEDGICILFIDLILNV